MKRLFNLIFENFHYKLIALIFSVLLWFLAAKKEVVSSEITAKIVIQPPENFYVIDYKPTKMHLFVEGLRTDISFLKENPYVIVKLTGNLPESKNYISIKISKNMLTLPVHSAEVKAFSPKFLKIKAEKLIKKVVPVKLEAYGIKEGYKLILSPNYVTIRVPESEKGKVKFIRTERVDISSIKGNAELFLNVETKYKPNPKRVKLIIRRINEGS